jgi:hypothetical protein
MIWRSWIRIWILIGNAIPDPDPGARKLTKKGFSTYKGTCFMTYPITYLQYIFHVKIQHFMTAKFDQDIDPELTPMRIHNAGFFPTFLPTYVPVHNLSCRGQVRLDFSGCFHVFFRI